VADAQRDDADFYDVDCFFFVGRLGGLAIFADNGLSVKQHMLCQS
jgi:hypothetical protein